MKYTLNYQFLLIFLFLFLGLNSVFTQDNKLSKKELRYQNRLGKEKLKKGKCESLNWIQVKYKEKTVRLNVFTGDQIPDNGGVTKVELEIKPEEGFWNSMFNEKGKSDVLNDWYILFRDTKEAEIEEVYIVTDTINNKEYTAKNFVIYERV
ncbi:MAG: hypothetical protein AAGK97_13520, partial [Bacteroidota bacterium]